MQDREMYLYHLQIILVLEMPVTVFAVVLEVPERLHMLVDRDYRKEYPRTSLTFEAFCPVIFIVHMLVASALRTELTSTSLAFYPVVIVIQVLDEFVYVREGV